MFIDKTMDIKKARELLGDKGKSMSDEEVIAVENQLRVLADIAIDTVLAMTPEERKELDRKSKDK